MLEVNFLPARLFCYPTVILFRAVSASIPSDKLRNYEKNADDNQQLNLIPTTTLGLALRCIAVLLRCIARWRTRASHKADDWLIILALVRILRPP